MSRSQRGGTPTGQPKPPPPTGPGPVDTSRSRTWMLCRSCQHDHPLAIVCLAMMGGTPNHPSVCMCDR